MSILPICDRHHKMNIVLKEGAPAQNVAPEPELAEYFDSTLPNELSAISSFGVFCNPQIDEVRASHNIGSTNLRF
jgi:hypothetical protein